MSRRRFSFKDLVSQNKSEILKDDSVMTKIEDRIEKKHSKKTIQ
ncbi:FbpB family small basic protein [Tuberibacillus sp. Marseille-P3662]|nr:FbpB family small basic protein [Tuberibacillus sp. Marseille-P3662]